MKYIKIINKKNQSIIGDKIGYANNPLSRFIGLMNRKELQENEGLLLTPCNSIHMFFMKIPLDVVFIDRKDKIVKTIENIKPWKISPVVFKAQSVLELPVGHIKKYDLQENDNLELVF
ncbi:MAG: DUF192 domain-containing protein [Candidatus Sericytochromatia bacterium]